MTIHKDFDSAILSAPIRPVFKTEVEQEDKPKPDWLVVVIAACIALAVVFAAAVITKASANLASDLARFESLNAEDW